MIKNSRSQGFAHAFLVIGLVIALLGALGFIFWQNFIHKEPVVTKESTKNTSPSVSTQTDTKKSTIGNVTFNTPKNWSQDDVSEGIKSNPALVGAMNFLPGEKLRTIYGDGKEFFHVRVAVYKNEKNYKPEDWFINDAGSNIGGEGVLSNNDTESKEKINSNDAYYRNTVNDSYEEVHYVISKGDTLVYIYARTYETSADLPGVGDFKKFEPAIAELAKSVRF
jgi:hypothetical protein